WGGARFSSFQKLAWPSTMEMVPRLWAQRGIWLMAVFCSRWTRDWAAAGWAASSRAVAAAPMASRVLVMTMVPSTNGQARLRPIPPGSTNGGLWPSAAEAAAVEEGLFFRGGF